MRYGNLEKIMSRIGKKPILIPASVEVKIEGSKVTIKGPRGELSKEFRPEIKIETKDEKILVGPQSEIIKKGKLSPRQARLSARQAKQTKSLWGLTRALIANMVKGVTEGYQKQLEIEGVGYRANLEGEDLVLRVGFSHLVKIKAPAGIKFLVEKNVITIFGADKESVGQIAAKIRAIKPPEPYKGKGIRYAGEQIRRKLGKKAVATTK